MKLLFFACISLLLASVASNCVDDITFSAKGKNCEEFLASKANIKCRRTIKQKPVAESCPSICNPSCRGTPAPSPAPSSAVTPETTRDCTPLYFSQSEYLANTDVFESPVPAWKENRICTDNFTTGPLSPAQLCSGYKLISNPTIIYSDAGATQPVGILVLSADVTVVEGEGEEFGTISTGSFVFDNMDEMVFSGFNSGNEFFESGGGASFSITGGIAGYRGISGEVDIINQQSRGIFKVVRTCD